MLCEVDQPIDKISKCMVDGGSKVKYCIYILMDLIWYDSYRIVRSW